MVARTLCAGVALLLCSCDALEGLEGAVDETPQPPTAEFNRLDLTARPSNDQLGAWFCVDLAPDLPLISERDLCIDFFGPVPEKTDLKFSFDLVFDLGNPNGFPIPLVELLLALSVFEGADQSELGAICVSFCDPEQGTCPDQGAEACRPADKEINGIEDFIPTTDELLEIARQAITGELFEDENLQFRYIPGRESSECRPASDGCAACDTEDGGRAMCCGEETIPLAGANCRVGEDDEGQTCQVCDGGLEAHIRFDLDLDTTLDVLEVVATDSVEALIVGDAPSFDIPYKILGTLFFDVPVLGRFAIEFGPVEGVFSLD